MILKVQRAIFLIFKIITKQPNHMSYLVSSDDDDLLNFTTPSSEGLETLSSDDEDASSSGSHIIKPLSTFGPLSSIPKPSPRSHSPDKSFSQNGGTAVTSNILSVLSSYRKVPGGRGGGGGGFNGGGLSGTLPRSPRSNTNEYDGGDQSPEGSMEHSMMTPTATKVIHGYMGSSNQLVPQHSTVGGFFDQSGRVAAAGGGCDEPRSPIENALFMQLHKGSHHHLHPQHTRSFSPNRIKSEGHSSSDSREDSRDTAKTAPVGNTNNNARLRHLASTVKQAVSTISAMGGGSSAMSPQQQRQIDEQAKKRQKEEDIRKAKLLQFLGGASKAKGVVGD